MLTFSCKPKDKLLLPTCNIAIEVVKVERGVVHLGIDGPPDVSVLCEGGRTRAAEGDARDCRPAGTHPRFLSQLADSLETTAKGLGLLSLQLDAGLAEEGKAILSLLQHDLSSLRYAVEGEREAPPARPARVAGKGRKALLVEDDSNERELLAGFLRHSGLKVDTAGDGSDALDYLGTQGRPDVILLDMGLPRVDGPTTLRTIRRNPAFAGIKIFGVSGRPPEDFDLECGPRGIDRWFHKPLDPAALVRELVEDLDGALGRA
jgi:CheY-like chemotaxis protein